MGHGNSPEETAGAPLRRPSTDREHPAWLRGIYAGLCLYFFLSAINVMGAGLKTMARDDGASAWMEGLFAHADNPFVALMAAVFVTAIVQSSSFTTSMIITMAASGALPVQAAIFAVMGANIGTSVTGIIVSMGNVRIRRQFRRAFTAALVHDIFNLLTVAVLFPIEWTFGLLSRAATVVSNAIRFDADKPNSPVKFVTGPVVDSTEWLAGKVFASAAASGTAVAIAGLLMLFLSLLFMVKNLRGALLHRIEGLFRSVFFRNDLAAGVVGTVTTILVQSSSITTSLIVPLAGAGAVKIWRVFPFMLGANIGTTITGVIAAAAFVGPPESRRIAATVAASHVLFNVGGICIWYPLRRVPIGLATWYGRLASISKRYAFLFLIMVFVVIPIVGLTITELLRSLSGGPAQTG